MLRRKYDPKKTLQVVIYLRMSSDLQNPRSPQQQLDNIKATIQRLGLPWVILKVYSDHGKSGRFIRGRLGFQQMLRDIRSGEVKADAILVDTLERLGRNDELMSLRKELDQECGTLILTANSGFGDPTTGSGKVMAAFESVRATEENEIKAHQVLRGKRDAALQGHWPGGEPPFGYQLQSVLVERSGRQEVDHSKLIPDPKTSGIIQRIFQMAGDHGYGCTRLTRILNDDLSIPAEYKPFYEQTVNYWLNNTIYFGQLVWEKRATDIINDRRVSQRNPEDVRITIPDFCEPLVSKDLWEKVHELRRCRRERISKAHKANKGNEAKQIAALAPGLALKYPLSGLVCCGVCKRAMNISVSPAYTTVSGETRRYASYACPGYLSRVCTNNHRILEVWLRSVVVGLITRRLFPLQGD